MNSLMLTLEDKEGSNKTQLAKEDSKLEKELGVEGVDWLWGFKWVFFSDLRQVGFGWGRTDSACRPAEWVFVHLRRVGVVHLVRFERGKERRERETCVKRCERREFFFFYNYNIHKDCYNGTLYIGFHCSI